MNNRVKAHPKEQTIKELFVGKCWSYLNDNFHKFTTTQKIKIALELAKKDIPQEIKGSLEVTEMPAIVKEFVGEQPINRISEFLIGSPDTAENS